MKVVLDTNILVSATFWEGESSKLVFLVQTGKIKCFLSVEILGEYEKVISSGEIVDKIEKNLLNARFSLVKLIDICEIVKPKEKFLVVKDDPADNKILEAAVESKSDFVITYDKHLLKLKEFRGIKVIQPNEALRTVQD